MSVYQLKPVQAIQFDGKNISEMFNFCGERFQQYKDDKIHHDGWILVNNGSPYSNILPGYWVVKGEKLPFNNDELSTYTNETFPYEKVI